MRSLRHPHPTGALPRRALLTAGLIAALAVAGGHPAGAQADDPLATAAEALRSDPVYVDPTAERALTDAEEDGLREAIRSADTPVFVAVLPSGAGDADEVARRLPEEVGLSGTYATVVGDGFRASSTQLLNADELATAAFQAEADAGPAAVLSRFVDDVAAASAGAAPGQAPVSGSEPDDGEDGVSSPLVPLALLGAGGAGLFVWSRRRRRRQDEEHRARPAADAQMIRAELDVVADDVLRLEPEVAMHPEARDDYEAGVERHRIASAALDYADEPVDLVRVARVAEEARYAMARARALVQGRQPPPPPEGLRRPGRHQEPPVLVGEGGAPVYAGGQPFYGGGWFGGPGSGLFSGLLLGSMLGGWGWGGWGWGGTVIVNDDGDGGGGDGGWGGGDWGGDGGWGGGDWGGGDLGGGDW